MAVEGGEGAEGRGRAARQIIDTARHTAALYLMQFQHITERMPHEPPGRPKANTAAAGGGFR